MRILIKKSTSTKAERRFSELLKKHHIPFIHRKLVDNREIDFVIGKYAVEINGHEQSPLRNKWLIERGFIPIHITNITLKNDIAEVEKLIIPKLKIYVTSR